ncbi:pre-mRNA splicing factor domain-containing protein [Actinidia rufa]|uniref:Pre-mRNA splicing factor domain-containing protein n=1 Tax=Actinidia rufa TaxID=165716 RepID=A0A7J0FXE5_9ERIC|nr:pre-mRNA splicing factor domain-containing protein [Actinidia rufa]
MALKFLNKKGWHTGSLRNIENVWKAEQKHDAEQKKLEELRKQIQEERERSEFRLLQEQAGLVPRQERLDFLYDSGLAVGKGSSDGFKALEAFPKPDPQTASSSSAKQQQPSVPGALFEEKPQSANDAWRKLHSDPLLLIRQREQEALARVRNNPIQMAMIRKSDLYGYIPSKGYQYYIEPSGDTCAFHTLASWHCFLDIPRVKRVAVLTPTDYLGHLMQKSKQRRRHLKVKTSERNVTTRSQSIRSVHHQSATLIQKMLLMMGNTKKSARKSSKSYEHSNKLSPSSVRELKDRNIQKKRNIEKDNMYKEQPACALLDSTIDNDESREGSKRHRDKAKLDKYYLEGRMDSESGRKWRENRHAGSRGSDDMAPRRESHQKRGNKPFKLSGEERAARLREMQMDAELHEEQRWKRLKKADENDAQEALSAHMSSRRNFLDAAHKSVYGADKGGSSTIEESVRRRTHYLQSRAEVGEGNAFRR